MTYKDYTTIHTKEYFEKYESLLFNKYEKECNFEYLLKIRIPDFSELPKEAKDKAIEVVTKMYAKEIAESAKKDLIKKMHMIQNVKNGSASLGYTSVYQECREMHDLVEGFEFSCYMLGKFKTKYKIA